MPSQSERSKSNRKNHMDTPVRKGPDHAKIFTDRLGSLYKITLQKNDFTFFSKQISDYRRGERGPRNMTQYIINANGVDIYKITWQGISVVVGQDKDGLTLPLPAESLDEENMFVHEKARLSEYMRTVLPIEFILAMANMR